MKEETEKQRIMLVGRVGDLDVWHYRRNGNISLDITHGSFVLEHLMTPDEVRALIKHLQAIVMERTA